MEVRDRVAVVTGGASGIGRGIALALASRGAAGVVVADLEEDKAAAVAREVTAGGAAALAVRCDVADEESVEALAEHAWRHFGHVEILFNNAGVSGGGPLLDASASDLRWILSVNLFGVWYGCAAFGRRFRDRPSPAWIVNTGSEHSLGFPHPQAGFYTASKHAVLGLTDVLRHELPPHVGVSLLCPGVVRTDLYDATRNRPRDLGGRGEPDALSQAVMERGMDPLEVGRLAVAGVEREEFYIVPHPHARRYVEERSREILAAFDRQATADPDPERYDVMRIVADVLSRR